MTSKRLEMWKAESHAELKKKDGCSVGIGSNGTALY